ncbi:MAG: hypothetical protein A3H57_00200 [Candidatus Taylorbacteria bacterium RIFCSPLOWO2_02_FULL_43_11]|nr:MAG: hypothetical protein A3H57_00200 [Candidatus Taylorbacteria bacterium RIFCSPLOWO2_02_FULL_43_11]
MKYLLLLILPGIILALKDEYLELVWNRQARKLFGQKENLSAKKILGWLASLAVHLLLASFTWPLIQILYYYNRCLTVTHPLPKKG